MNYYVADAFCGGPFTGNPAGVCIVENWPGDGLLHNIAAQNNLAETAFVLPLGGNRYHLRWFTPETEVDLCGHATLAASFILKNFADKEAEDLEYDSQSGKLFVSIKNDLYYLNFPSRKPAPAGITLMMEEAIGAKVLEAHRSRDLVLLLESEEAVRNLKPDMGLLSKLPDFGVCVTAKGTTADFVSRYFAPREGIPEDPVTGSAHSTLTPFWAERLSKTEMTAKQLSARGGALYVKDLGERVEIAGRARLYLKGEIFI